MKYFNNVSTLEELRRQYKELLKRFHPDNPQGSTQATQEINAEYDRLFKLLKDKHESKSDKTADSTNTKQSEYSKNMYDWENDKSLREVLQKIINFDGIEITICGQWLWISGNTFNYKNELKEIGFKWASQKKMWFWHGEAFRKKSRKTLSMEEIQSYYGSTKVQTDSRILLEA
ncbi:J domain-containing protein [Lachnospiraceae bacterium MD335]|nr:J domain-containing protein [Lachnospiraceae bacterium MD335]